MNRGEYKKRILRNLWKNKKIVSAIDSKHKKYDSSSPDTLVYTHIFPALKVPYVVEDTSTYILLDVGTSNQSVRNDFFCEMWIKLWVMVHTDKLEMPGAGGTTRLDYISDEIEETFSNSTEFGYGLLQWVSTTPYIYNERFLYNELIFKNLDAKTSPTRSPVHP